MAARKRVPTDYDAMIVALACRAVYSAISFHQPDRCDFPGLSDADWAALVKCVDAITDEMHTDNATYAWALTTLSAGNREQVQR